MKGDLEVLARLCHLPSRQRSEQEMRGQRGGRSVQRKGLKWSVGLEATEGNGDFPRRNLGAAA